MDMQVCICASVYLYSASSPQGCSRLLVTVDLNLTNAEFIQFYFMYGCLITPNNRNQGVLLEYSVNGGITWNLLMEIFYDQYTKPGCVLCLVGNNERVEQRCQGPSQGPGALLLYSSVQDVLGPVREGFLSYAWIACMGLFS